MPKSITVGELHRIMLEYPQTTEVYFATSEGAHSIGRATDYDNINFEGLTLLSLGG